MEEVIVLEEICRLCLTTKSKDGSLLLFKISESMQNKFEDFTQKKVNKTRLELSKKFNLT